MTKDAVIEARKEAQRITNAIHRVMASEDGKLMYSFLRSYFRVDGPVFERSLNHGYDAISAALHDGARGVFILIDRKLAEPATGDDQNEPKTVVVR